MAQVFEDALHLLILSADAGWKQATQSEGVALSVGKRGAFVQHGVLQQGRAGRQSRQGHFRAHHAVILPPTADGRTPQESRMNARRPDRVGGWQAEPSGLPYRAPAGFGKLKHSRRPCDIEIDGRSVPTSDAATS